MSTVFGKRLREARAIMGLSQKQLGILAGIDASSASPRINQYEQGKHIPDIGTAERLAAVLRVPAPFFYARDDEVATWIVAYQHVTAAKRRALLSSVDKGDLSKPKRPQSSKA